MNKTGTLEGVRTLAGYAHTSGHGRVRFVIRSRVMTARCRWSAPTHREPDCSLVINNGYARGRSNLARSQGVTAMDVTYYVGFPCLGDDGVAAGEAVEARAQYGRHARGGAFAQARARVAFSRTGIRRPENSATPS